MWKQESILEEAVFGNTVLKFASVVVQTALDWSSMSSLTAEAKQCIEIRCRVTENIPWCLLA